MKLNRLFSSFKHKLLLEGVLASCLSGGIVAGGAAFVVSFVYHVLAMPTPMSILWLASGVGFALTFALVFALRFYPTKKRIARRLDETGLQERASTMIAFWKEEEGMAKLQREDATRHIEKKRAKDIKLRIGKWQAVMCLVCVLLATTMVLLPIDIFVFATGREVYDPEKDALIDKLIEQLREEVKNTQLSDEIKEDIDEIIDRLEEDLKDAESELEQAGKVEDAKQEISERLEQELTKNSIGLELQKFTLTRPLGEALCETNKKKVSSALDALESKIKNDHYSARELADLIKRALQASEVPASDALYSAFDIFADELNSLDVKDPSFDSKVTKSFSTVEAKILDILTQQAVIESEKVKLEQEMDKVKEEILEGEKEEAEGEDESKGDGEDGPGSGEEEGENPGENGENGKQPGESGEEGEEGGDQPNEGEEGEGNNPNGGAGGNGQIMEDTRVEIFYDPISGSVSYGKVFETYYAAYLKALKEGNVSPQLQEIIDRYFDQLQ